MDDKKILEIYNLVKQLTDAKKIDWKRGESKALDQLFVATIPGYMIRLFSTSFSSSFVIRKGEIVLGKLTDNNLSPGNSFHGIKDFIRVVQRQADKIDDNLDDLLNKLKGI